MRSILLLRSFLDRKKVSCSALAFWLALNSLQMKEEENRPTGCGDKN